MKMLSGNPHQFLPQHNDHPNDVNISMKQDKIIIIH